MPPRIYIIDTCSIIEVRRAFPRATQRLIYERFTELVGEGILIYPKHVLDELERTANPLNIASDPPYAWAKANAAEATKTPFSYDTVREVLAHPQARRVLDVYKTSGADEADPYLLALALDLQRAEARRSVSVITEEKNDTPDKLSLNSVCGILNIPALPVAPFVSTLGIST